MEEVQTLNDLLLQNPHGLDDQDVALLRQKLPPAFLLSPLTKQTRDWLRINEDVLDCWLTDRRCDPNYLERLGGLVAESDAYFLASEMVFNQLERDALLLEERECAAARKVLDLPLWGDPSLASSEV